MDLRALEEELKKLGVSVVSSQQETVISIRVKGLAGKALDRGLRLCDQLLQEKVKNVLKTCTDPTSKLFKDPTFGPKTDDPQGASALCKTGTTIPSKGGSQHQLKVLALLKAEKLRWERPEYAVDDEGDIIQDNQNDNDDADAEDDSSSRNVPEERIFASDAKLFSDGVCSGDVIQGNLGDCWFLSALSVVATRSDLLEQTFWRGDKSKSKGLFVCKFMKNFVWNYVMIDDRLPVYGFSKTKEGKPYFARCRDPNELWVSLLEKAYAKLHGSYEALIGGFIDVALNDLTGMCSEQVIMKSGYPGFGEDPFAPAKPQQQRGDPFWEKILRYKSSGTLMGCSIQPAPTSADKNIAPESCAGNGLYFKHAYALVDAAGVKTTKQENVKLVKLRNPWGMGEWTGPWSDSSEERIQNQDVIEQYFKILKRRVGGNLSKRVFLSLNGKGELTIDEISQEEVIDINANDGTFFMSYDAWMQYFTHFFAGIDFPDEWHGRRVEGCWNEANCGGNTTKSTWINNPRFEFVVQERSTFFISLSQEDPRGKENLKIVPIGFHICSLTPVSQEKGSKCEIKEPPGKDDTYYRLYKEKDRVDFKKGIRPETLPPAIIPSSVVKGVDDDGVLQPAYTFKQAVSVDVTMDPGKYCIIPSMYMRTDKDTGKTNVGSFWVSVYSNKSKFSLEGGERIVEEEEGGEDDGQNQIGVSGGDGMKTRASFVISGGSLSSPGKKPDNSVSMEAMSVIDRRRRFEDAKDELLAQAKAKGIGLRQLKMEFAKAGSLKKLDIRKKLLSMGFKADELSDEKINVLFSGLDESSKGSIESESILNLFEAEIHEDQMACEIPEVEDDEVPEKIHDEGVLSLELRGARDLPVSRARISRSQDLQRTVVRLPPTEFTTAEAKWRKACALAVCERNPALAAGLRPVLRRNGWLPASMKIKPRTPAQGTPPSPVEVFYEALENEMKNRISDRVAELKDQDLLDARVGSSVQPTSMIVPLNTPSKAATAARALTESSTSLHKSNRMQALEEKRCRRLGELQRKKQETLGDRSKAASLPRLIGGRKSGSTYVQCSDCCLRVRVPGRAEDSDVCSRDSKAETPPSYVCSGSRCFNALCSACYFSLPRGKKVCEDCFEHEITPSEAFGSQLRALLIEKMGASKGQQGQVEAYFATVDKDKSGALSYEEFSSAMASFEIEPALTDDQTQALMQQFDTNKDGEVSLSEFKEWVFKDHVWEPGVLVEASVDAGRPVATPEIRSGVIAPILDALFDAVYEAHLVSVSTTQWVTTSNALSSHCMKATVQSDAQYRQSSEVGSILFQRVHTLKMAASGDTDDAGSSQSSIDEVFAQYDTDGSGLIDPREFRDLLSALGMHLSDDDAKLLMRRVESTTSLNDTLDLAEFRAYVDDLTSTQQSQRASRQSLIGSLLKIDTVISSDAAKREAAQEILHQFHWNLRSSQAARLSKLLRRRVGVSVGVQEIQRLSNTFHFREVVPTSSAQSSSSKTDDSQQGNTADKDTMLDLNNSGDVLSRLLFSRSGSSLSTMLKTFSLPDICSQIAVHLESVTKTTAADGIWKTLFGGGASTAQPVDQREFLDKLLLSGFSPALTEPNGGLTQRLSTKTLVALALDMLRCEGGEAKANDDKSWSMSFNLFAVMLQYGKIEAIEKKFAHALRSYLQFCQGTQSYLVEVAAEQDNLVVRAIEPARKYKMDFVLRPDEYTRLAISQLSSSIWPRTKVNTGGGRHAAFTQNAHALITDANYPRLHDAILALLSRLRITVQDSMSAQHTMTPFLTLVEDAAFVQTLETMFSRARLPFFWSVSPTTLEFSIDGDYLLQMKSVSFHQLIAETLSSKPAAKPLHSLLKFMNSSLSVRYEIIGQNAAFDSSWTDFQALLSGHQNTFAVLQVRPQGDTFVTKVDRTGGNGAPKWNLKQLVPLKEPERSDHRLDRPIVYSDTVRVSSIPDGSSTKRITFAVVDSSVSKQSSAPGHFVVLSVRKALPETKTDKARLYCTAYDPFTSCDFAVEGYPTDWAPDFFNAATNPDFEMQWLEIVKTMYLGLTLTPKVMVQVFAKHAKVEKLIGECEISVSSVIAHEGHIFDDWFPLLHPSGAGVTTGAINLAFTFDSKKTSDVGPAGSVAVPRLASNSTPVKANEQRAAGVVSVPNEAELRRLKDLEVALQQSESEKREALEQARKLKAQLLQQANTPPSRSLAQAEDSNEVARWKSKLEQVRRDQEAEHSTHEKRLAALQAELHRLEQEREESVKTVKDIPLPVVVAANLKQAALEDDASVFDIMSAMKDILTHRSPDRPYNGLKKAMAAVAELPGKVSVAAFDDALDDFGLGLSTSHRKTLLGVLDPESKGRVNIEDFFVRLCGDTDAIPTITIAKSRSTQAITPRTLPTPEPSPPKHTPLVPAPGSPTRASLSNTQPAPSRPQKMSWKEMKKFLLLNLPEGWETRFTEKGRPYFCNHANRSTQWKHPTPEVEVKYSEWIKEHGANFQRLSSTTTPTTTATMSARK